MLNKTSTYHFIMRFDQEDHQTEDLFDMSSSDEELEMAKRLKVPDDKIVAAMTDSQLREAEDAEADDESESVSVLCDEDEPEEYREELRDYRVKLLPLSLILLAYGVYRCRRGIVSLAKSLFD